MLSGEGHMLICLHLQLNLLYAKCPWSYTAIPNVFSAILDTLTHQEGNYEFELCNLRSNALMC